MKLLVLIVFIIGSTVAVNQKLSLHKFLKPNEPTWSAGQNINAKMTFSSVENTFEQRLDNFDNRNPGRFHQRYIMNGEYFQPGGPIIIIIGGEWEISPWLLQNSLPTDLAAENEGYLFYLEHRFYGDSLPSGNITTDLLKYLTVDQALADIAHFINYIKQTYVTPGAEHSHVILIGSHYAGSLAVWFRQKYPHLAVAAWASSAPLLAKADHFEYKELTGAVYRQIGGDQCYDRIQKGFQELEALVENGNLTELSRAFNLCDTLDGVNDIRLFFNTIAEIFAFFVQSSDWLAPIDDVCKAINTNGSASNAVAEIIMSIFHGVKCLPINFNFEISIVSNTDPNSDTVESGVRQWIYQLCDHLGWYHSSASSHQPFGTSFPVDFFYDFCTAAFGRQFNKTTITNNIDRLNTAFGGMSPDVTNVLYTHGELDPWRSVGVQQNSYNATVLFIKGGSLSNDLRPFSEHDSPELTAVRFQILELLHYWLAHASGVEVVPV